eukprot:7373142-Karenia_brevis.AAC.1
MATVDFKKAFDMVEHAAIWVSLLEAGVPSKYVQILSSLYSGQKGVVVSEVMSKSFTISRGTKQGDPMSPHLFNA